MKTTSFSNSPHVLPGNIWLLLFVCLVLPGTPCSGAPEHDLSSAERKIHQPDVMTGDILTDPGRPFITLHNGKVAMNMPSSTVDQALNKFSSVTGIEILCQGEENKKPVSLSFSDRSIGEAIQIILRGVNFLLVYSDTQRDHVISKVVILPSGAETDDEDRHDDYEDTNNLSHVSVADIDAHQAKEKLSDPTPELEEAMRSRIEGMNRVRSIAIQDDQYQAIEDLKVELLVNDEAEARLLALTSLNEKGQITTEMLMNTVSSETDPRVQLHAINLLVERAENDSMVEGFLTSFFESQMSTK